MYLDVQCGTRMAALRKDVPTTTWRVTVDTDLAVMLEAYCRAQAEATDRLSVVRRALREYVDRRLKNRGLRRRYDRERAALLRGRPAGLTLIKKPQQQLP